MEDLIWENFDYEKNSIERRKILWVHFFFSPEGHDNICPKVYVNISKYMNFVFNNTKYLRV
jgi:hypothetical protein